MCWLVRSGIAPSAVSLSRDHYLALPCPGCYACEELADVLVTERRGMLDLYAHGPGTYPRCWEHTLCI